MGGGPVEDQQPEPGAVRKGPPAAVGIAAALFVAAGGYAGAMAHSYLSDRALVHTKLVIARAATETITTLWSYTPDIIDSMPDRAAHYLTGDLAGGKLAA